MKLIGKAGHGRSYWAGPGSKLIDSNFLAWSKTLELVSDPVAWHILRMRIANELAGRGIEVNFS